MQVPSTSRVQFGQRRPSVRTALRVLAGLAVTWLLLMAIGLACWTHRPSARFDAARWREVARSDDMFALSRRAKMVRDLSRHHRRRGMTRPEVVALLGEPDGPAEAPILRYDVGLVDNLFPAIDPSFLDIQLDASGHVTAWHVWES